MERKILRRKTLIGSFLFIAIFSTLLALASIYDLQVSQILTEGHLDPGSYYANRDFMFGLTFEAIGSVPIWIAIAAFGAILYCNAKNGTLIKTKKDLKPVAFNILTVLSCFIGLVAVVGGIYFLFAHSFKYLIKYTFDYGLKSTSTYVAVNIIFAAIISPIFVKFFELQGKEKLEALKTIAWIILVAMVTRIFIEGIKTPIGRMRYRAMNCIGDFQYYTPWYVINGSRELTDVVANTGNVPLWEIDDACKSFPSGHTFAAGMSYVIICLPDIYKKWDNVIGRFLCWLIPIVITGVVAIARIAVGAHYFSDVLIGGTVVFLGVIIGREIFICKGKHIKCFLKEK